jgi:hypothetical protein
MSWAATKCEHANDLALRLQEDMKAWSRLPDDMYDYTVADDELTFEVRLSDTFPRPPVQAWSLSLGDVVHNLRAALDAVVWQYVDAATLTESQQRSIHFPLCLTEEDWLAKVPNALRTVPSQLVERIRHEQPFLMEDPAQCVLNLIHDLDRQDKHREMVGTRAVVTEARSDLEIFTELPWPGGSQRPFELVPFELEPRALVLRGWSPHPVKRVLGRIGLELDFWFAPELPIGESLIEMLEMMTSSVRGTVHSIQGTLDELLDELDRTGQRRPAHS